MCIHCCRLRRTPCPPIPYSCPHCPVRTISSCCPLGSRPFAENPFLVARTLVPPSDPCDTLPPRWLDVNRRVIFALAESMNRSPEAAHYGVLRLLYANYGDVMMISRKRRSFWVPISRFPDQDLFTAGGSLFDDRGFLTDPMAPETLGKLLPMMQDYIFRLRLLNKKYKWYGNGEDRGEILPLLGEQDELVRLLRATFGDSDAVPVPQLLQALNSLDFSSLFGKVKSRRPPWQVKSISDLYSEVVSPFQAKKPLEDTKESSKQIEEVTFQPIVPSKKPLTASQELKAILSPRSSLKPQAVESKFTSTDRDTTYLQAEMPRLFYEPFDSTKSSTWLSRHPDTERVLPDGRIAKRRVRRYRDQDEQQALAELQRQISVHSEKDFGTKEYGDMFGADTRRRSTRRSSTRRSSSRRSTLLPSTRKSLSAR